MYCPKCGRCMTFKDGTLTCEKGDMPLTRRLQELLLAAYPSPQPHPTEDVGADLSRLYCPSCGVTLDKSYVCPICKKALSQNGMLYSLIEFHPHLTEDGRGRI